MVNSRDKCLVISKDAGAKPYDNSMLFVYNIIIILLVYLSLPFSFLFTLTFSSHFCIGTCVQLVACIRSKLCSLSLSLFFTSAKVLTRLAIRQLLYVPTYTKLGTKINCDQTQILEIMHIDALVGHLLA